jgi:hypothetical protein
MNSGREVLGEPHVAKNSDEGHGFTRAVKESNHEGFSPEGTLLNFRGQSKHVFLSACDFFDLFVFVHIQPAIFQVSHKAVILSEAHRRSVA